MMPCRRSQTTISAVLWPARLSHTRSMRRGGSSAGKVKRSARPSCQASHAARGAAASGGAAGGGSASRAPPGGGGPRRIGGRGGSRQRRQDHPEPLLEPAMQDRVGAAADRLEVHLSRRGMEQGQDLAGATPDILVRPGRRVALRSPAAARLRHGLERTGLVLAPDLQAEGGAERVGSLDQPLFAAASGSATVTGPSCLRRRTTTPVWHQLRPLCQLYPAACNARPIV